MNEKPPRPGGVPLRQPLPPTGERGLGRKKAAQRNAKRPARMAEPAQGEPLRFALSPVTIDDDSRVFTASVFEAESPARVGGQGSVFAVRDADDPEGRYALKLFATKEAALREWAVLRLHRNDRTVPLGYAIGKAVLRRDAGDGEAEGAGERGGTAAKKRNSTGKTPSEAYSFPAEDRWAVVMELVEGRTLEEAMADPAFAEGLTVEGALRILAPVVRFCARAQESRLPQVHRDIKPANIMLADDGSVHLVDFGIAAGGRRVGAPGNGEGDGCGVGTPGFTAPEVLVTGVPGAGAAGEEGLGVSARAAAADDPRVDSYGIGAMAAFLLGGGALPDREPSGELSSAGLRPQDAGAGARPQDAVARPDAAVPGPVPVALPHDAALVDQLERRIRADVAAKLGKAAAAQLAPKAVRASLERMDAKIAQRVGECLSPRQDDRPFPSQLESVLPLNRQHYENELFSHGVIAALSTSGGAGAAEAGAGVVAAEPGAGTVAAAASLPSFADEAAADRSFADALNAFNSGCYGRALPILRKRADEGDLSAMYYLGVCIRDGLGPLRPDEGWAHVEHYFSEAARAGNLLAQNAYGQLLFEGAHVRPNPEEGLRLIRLAAKDDSASGKTGLSAAKDWLAERGL